jgi:hypothetical protein
LAENEFKRLQREAYERTVGRWDLPIVGRERSRDAWHWFGDGEGGVIAGLCELLDRHLRRGGGRLQPAAIGCVPAGDGRIAWSRCGSAAFPLRGSGKLAEIYSECVGQGQHCEVAGLNYAAGFDLPQS